MTEIHVINANSYTILAAMPEASVDWIITDPPYELGFMGLDWDSAGIAFDVDFWKLCYRVLRTGGRLRVFGHVKTYSMVMYRIREAGFQVELLKAWTYSENMPKNHNLSKAFDRMAQVERPVIGHKRGVGGENLNDIVHQRHIRSTTDEGGKGVGAYGVGAKQVAVEVAVTKAVTEEAILWEPYGTALKTAFEPIIMARKV